MCTKHVSVEFGLGSYPRDISFYKWVQNFRTKSQIQTTLVPGVSAKEYAQCSNYYFRWVISWKMGRNETVWSYVLGIIVASLIGNEEVGRRFQAYWQSFCDHEKIHTSGKVSIRRHWAALGISGHPQVLQRNRLEAWSLCPTLSFVLFLFCLIIFLRQDFSVWNWLL